MRRMNRVTRVVPFCLLIISLMSSMVRVSSQTREGARRRPSTSGQERPATVKEQKTARQPTTAKPTAAWLLAAPNPLNVGAIPSQYSGVSKVIMSASGGSLTATGPDGTRFILTVPPNAVPEDAKITMSPIVAIENLPFSGGLVAAVQITPNVQFYKAATLLIEPAQPIPAREQMSFASFAYHGDGREFHLYPMETDPSRIAFNLLRLGGYGVARGTKTEQETVRARIPTDPEDRLFMQMQKALSLIRERRLLAASSRVSSLTDVYDGSPRFMRASFGRGEVPQQVEGEAFAAFLKDFLAKQLELYDQVIMPGLRNARPGCTPEEQEQLAKILDDAFGWERRVELLGLTSRTDDRRERLRADGWTDAEIQAMDASADEYRQKVQAIRDEFFRLLKESFDKFYECCIETPNMRYPPELVRVERQAALWFAGEPANLLGPNYAEKIERCACSASNGGWQGTIKYKEIFKDEGEYKNPSQVGNWNRDEYYEATIQVTGVQQGFRASGIQSEVRARAEQNETRMDQGVSTVLCNKQTNSTSSSSGDANQQYTVNVIFNPDGRYRIGYRLPQVKISGQKETTRKLLQCKNPFVEVLPFNTAPLASSVSVDPPQIEEALDPKNPNRLKGTKTVTIPVSRGKRTGILTWNLIKCGSQ